MAEYTLPIRVRTGNATESNGSGKKNQDKGEVWRSPLVEGEKQVTVLLVCDGHGTLGEEASGSVVIEITTDLKTNYQQLYYHPVTYIGHLTRTAHSAIEAEFERYLVDQRIEFRKVQTPRGNFFVQKRQDKWEIVEGGTTFSLAVIVGTTLYMANLGDSSGTICTPLDQKVLSTSMVHKLAGPEDDDEKTDEPVSIVVVTSEHKVESPKLYKRLLENCPSRTDPSKPSLKQVYDACPLKPQKSAISFDADGNPITVPHGNYYSTVRNDWAALVRTESDPEYVDCYGRTYIGGLAMPEALGNFYLQTQGLSMDVNVNVVELAPILEMLANKIICIVLASDGVWDNWKYEDIAKFVMDPSCIGALSEPDGVQRITNSFMQRNMIYAKRNFGHRHDDSTACIAFVEFSI